MKNWLFRFFVAPVTPHEERAFNTFVTISRTGRAKMLLAAFEGLDKEKLWIELKDLMDKRAFDLACDNAKLGHIVDAILTPDTLEKVLCSCCGGGGPWRTMSVQMDDLTMELDFCGLCDNRPDIIEDSTPERAMMTSGESFFFTQPFMDFLMNSSGKSYDAFLRNV